MLRFCKFTTRQKVNAAALSVLAGILFLILGAELPKILEQAWTDNLKLSAPLKETDLRAAPKVGRAFGGEDPDSEDSGVDLKVWIGSIKNPKRVLEYGARPLVEEKGPFLFRSYMEPTDATVDDETTGEVVGMKPRYFVKHVSGDLDETVVMPNIAFRFTEHVINERSDSIGSKYFERGAAALFFGKLLERIKGGLIMKAIKRLLFPELTPLALEAAASSIFNSSTHKLMQEWRTGTARSALHSFVLPERRFQLFGLSQDPGPLDQAVADQLWSFSNVFSFLKTVPSTPGGDPPWTRYLHPTDAWANTNDTRKVADFAGVRLESPIMAEAASFAAYFRYAGATTNATYGGPDGVKAAEVHLDQISRWVSEAVLTAAYAGDRYELDLVRLARSHSFIGPTEGAAHVVTSQLASNSMSGLAFWQRNRNINSGAYTDLAEVAGESLLNTCPLGTAATGAGASLADYPGAASTDLNIHVPLELSCLPYRESASQVTDKPESALAAAAAAATMSNAELTEAELLSDKRFRSKPKVHRMHTFLDLVGSGSAMTRFTVPGTKSILLFLEKAEDLSQDATLSSTVISTARSEIASREGALYWIKRMDDARARLAAAPPGSDAATTAEADMRTAASRYDAHVNYAAGSGGEAETNDELCYAALPTNLKEPAADRLRCYEFSDISAWILFIAKFAAWFPDYVNRNPSTGVVSPVEIRSGPLVRLTVREALFGMTDRLFLDLDMNPPGGLYPGVFNLMNTPKDEFDLNKASIRKLRINTGVVDLSKVGHIQQLGPGDTLSVFQQKTVVGGHYSRKVTNGTYDRRSQISPELPIPSGLIAWDKTMLRRVRYDYDREVAAEGASGLRLWRLRQASATEWPYFKSDKEEGTPDCLRSLKDLGGPLWDNNVKSGISLFMGKPNFLDCTAAERSVGYTGLRPPAADEDESFWDVEPTTGVVAKAVERWALYLKWAHSPWYPFLRTTYGQLARFERTTRSSEEDLLAIKRDIDFVNYQVDTAIPAGLFTLGTLLLIQGIIFVYVIFYPPKEPIGEEERRRRRKLRRQRLRDKRKKQAAAEKVLIKEQMKADKVEKANRKPGAVVMSSVLGSVATTPSAGTRGAPSFAGIAAGGAAATGGKLRPWQKPKQGLGLYDQAGPTDVISAGTKTPSAAAAGSKKKDAAADEPRAKDTKTIAKMTLSQAMHAKDLKPADTEVVERPDGSTITKKIKKGRQPMKLRTKRRRKRRVAPAEALDVDSKALDRAGAVDTGGGAGAVDTADGAAAAARAGADDGHVGSGASVGPTATEEGGAAPEATTSGGEGTTPTDRA